MSTWTDSTAASTPSRAEPLPAAWGRAVVALLAGFVALKLVLLFVLAWNTKFLMDEYWLVGHTWMLSAEPYQNVWPAKTLLYAVFFRLAHALGGGAVEVMLAARLQTAVLAVLGLGLLYAVARRIGRSRLESLFVLGAVLAFSSYLEGAFMTRPEPLALFFTLGALWVATRAPGDLRAIAAAGVLSGLAFLATQKAAYFNLALGLALVGDGLARRALGQALGAGAALVGGWAATVLAYGAYFAFEGAALGDVLRQVFYGSVPNAVHGHTVYDDLRVFVVHSFLRNPGQYLLCLAGWAILAPRLRRLGRPERIAWIFAGVIVTLVHLHPAPWPYNFVMAIPFLGLWSPCLPRLLARGDPGRQALILGALVLALGLSFARNLAYLGHDNAAQNATVRQAESLLGPGDTYADGIGMVVTRRAAARRHWWARGTLLRIRDEAARGRYDLIEAVFADAPKVWILSYRTDAVAAVLEPYLRRSYVPVFPNVLLAGVALAPGWKTTFEVRWPGAYRAYGADGRPARVALMVDGRASTEGVVGLGPGRHVVRARATQTVYLLPADLGADLDLSRPPGRRPLFQDAHTF